MSDIPRTAIYSYGIAIIWAINMFILFYLYPSEGYYGLFCAGMSCIFVATSIICVTIADNKEERQRYELQGPDIHSVPKKNLF